MFQQWELLINGLDSQSIGPWKATASDLSESDAISRTGQGTGLETMPGDTGDCICELLMPGGHVWAVTAATPGAARS